MLHFFGSQPIGSVRRSDIQAWVRDPEEFLAPATIQVVYRYVAAIFGLRWTRSSAHLSRHRDGTERISTAARETKAHVTSGKRGGVGL